MEPSRESMLTGLDGGYLLVISFLYQEGNAIFNLRNFVFR